MNQENANNETISKARGECRHELHPWLEDAEGNGVCSGCHVVEPTGAPIYDYKPSAWTPELYEWIESEGLIDRFTFHIYDISIPKYNEGGTLDMIWIGTTATPAQKAEALARAIKESGRYE